MIGLAAARFDPEVEAVLMRVYGVDSHSITLRRLKVLLHRLRLGEWTRDAGPASWSQEAYMLANVIDAVNQVSWVVAQANSRKRLPAPKPVERPGHGEKKSWDAFADALEGMEGVTVNG